MALSKDLISQFVKITNDDKKAKGETFVYGTIVEYKGDKYVQLDGSELLTPISTTTDTKAGERVTVMIKNHSATVTGNVSSPSARSDDVNAVKQTVDELNVEELVNKISEFEIIVADKVSSDELDVERARIDELRAEDVVIKESLTAAEADIDNLQASSLTITDRLTAAEANISKLETEKMDIVIADAKFATIDDLEATNIDIHNLEATYGEFSSSTTDRLNAIDLVMDCLSGGKGIAFGKTAELEDVAEFEFSAKFNSPVYGKALGMDRLPAIPSGSDLNNYVDPGCYAIQSNSIAATCSNIPINIAGRLEVWSATGEGIRSEQLSYLRQRYIPYNSPNAVWERDISRNSDNVFTFYNWWRTSLTPTASDFVYHEPTVLWGEDMASGLYMTAGDTANLKEAVSAQRHGIVLTFCAYNGTDDTNYSWQSFYVPKQLVALSTSGHTFTLIRGNFTYTGTKYLYINDTSITGHDDNNLTGTSNGITYANNKFVLRYVFGV